VAVNPDIDSKNASTGPSSPANTKGTPPTPAAINQLSYANKRAWEGATSSGIGAFIDASPPTIIKAKLGAAKTPSSPQLPIDPSH